MAITPDQLATSVLPKTMFPEEDRWLKASAWHYLYEPAHPPVQLDRSGKPIAETAFNGPNTARTGPVVHQITIKVEEDLDDNFLESCEDTIETRQRCVDIINDNFQREVDEVIPRNIIPEGAPVFWDIGILYGLIEVSEITKDKITPILQDLPRLTRRRWENFPHKREVLSKKPIVDPRRLCSKDVNDLLKDLRKQEGRLRRQQEKNDKMAPQNFFSGPVTLPSIEQMRQATNMLAKPKPAETAKAVEAKDPSEAGQERTHLPKERSNSSTSSQPYWLKSAEAKASIPSGRSSPKKKNKQQRKQANDPFCPIARRERQEQEDRDLAELNILMNKAQDDYCEAQKLREEAEKERKDRAEEEAKGKEMSLSPNNQTGGTKRKRASDPAGSGLDSNPASKKVMREASPMEGIKHPDSNESGSNESSNRLDNFIVHKPSVPADDVQPGRRGASPFYTIANGTIERANAPAKQSVAYNPFMQEIPDDASADHLRGLIDEMRSYHERRESRLAGFMKAYLGGSE